MEKKSFKESRLSFRRVPPEQAGDYESTKEIEKLGQKREA